MNKVNVGTIGHVDHGRTTLGAALAGVIADAEEKGLRVVVVDGKEARGPGPGHLSTSVDDLIGRDEWAGPRYRGLPSRKQKKKAKLRDLQRRAFLKE